jgi:Tol biopolymer transport system component
VPPALRTIILRCLAKEPGQRYRRAGEVHAALEAVDSSARVTRDDIARQTEWPQRPHRARWFWIGAAALTIAAVIGALSWRRLATPSWPTGGHWVRLATGDGRAFDPALSQDGKMVAYVAETGGRLDLFVARVAGGQPIALTNDEATEAFPRFSADSERIVFSRRLSGSPNSDVCVIATLGGEVRTLVPNAAQPAWSPSGTHLAFIRREARDNVMELATSAADGGDVHVLLRGDGTYPFLRSPAWSPDGRQIAVVRGRGGVAAEIWTVAAAGGRAPVKVAAEGTSVFSDDPVFTPDGRAIIYSSNRGGATNLWAMPLNGGSPVRLTNGTGPDEAPTIARDGTIALVNSRWRHVLFVHDLQTGASRPLHTETPFIWAPVWSSDGTELAFSRGDADGAWHIWVVSAAGGAPRQLTSSALSEVYPRYLPDGSGVLYHTWETPHRIWRVPHAGGPAVAVTDGPNDQFADVSPDGQSIAFVRSDQNAERIYVAPLAGGTPRLLTSSAGSVPRWSPDGKWIAFSRDRGYAGGVVIIGADGTGERALTDKGGWPVWWPDNQHIGYRIVAPDGNQQILVAPLDGGPSVPIDALKFSGTNEPFDLFRDGRRLTSSNAQHVSDEIWIIRQ